MSFDLLKLEALKLSKQDRVALLKLIADSLAPDSDDDSISSDVLEELERRMADDSPTQSASKVKDNLRNKYGLRG